MASQQGLRKALGAIKDSIKVGLAKVKSTYKEFDIAVVKATNHVECPPKEKHVRMIFLATSALRPRVDVAYCIHALARRIAKTHNWTVALKSMMVIHRMLKEGDSMFREELINYGRSRGHILNLSNFKDDSSPHGAEGELQALSGNQRWNHQSCGQASVVFPDDNGGLRERSSPGRSNVDVEKRADRSPPHAREDSMPSFKEEEEEEDASPKALPPAEELPAAPLEAALVQLVGDLLGLDADLPNASALEDVNALALAIVLEGQSANGNGLTFDVNDPTGWKLALVTNPTDSVTAAANCNKLVSNWLVGEG